MKLSNQKFGIIERLDDRPENSSLIIPFKNLKVKIVCTMAFYQFFENEWNKIFNSKASLSQLLLKFLEDKKYLKGWVLETLIKGWVGPFYTKEKLSEEAELKIIFALAKICLGVNIERKTLPTSKKSILEKKQKQKNIETTNFSKLQYIAIKQIGIQPSEFWKMTTTDFYLLMNECIEEKNIEKMTFQDFEKLKSTIKNNMKQ